MLKPYLKPPEPAGAMDALQHVMQMTPKQLINRLRSIKRKLGERSVAAALFSKLRDYHRAKHNDFHETEWDQIIANAGEPASEPAIVGEEDPNWFQLRFPVDPRHDLSHDVEVGP